MKSEEEQKRQNSERTTTEHGFCCFIQESSGMVGGSAFMESFKLGLNVLSKITIVNIAIRDEKYFMKVG